MKKLLIFTLFGFAIKSFSMQPNRQILRYDALRDFNQLYALFLQERKALTHMTVHGDIKTFVKLQFSKDNTFVCRDATNLLGFVNYFYLPASICCCFWYQKPSCSISYLAVDPYNRQKGIATRLLASVEQYAKTDSDDLAQMDIFTQEINEPASKLFKKLGYRTAPNMGPCVLYTKSLSSSLAEKKAQ